MPIKGRSWILVSGCSWIPSWEGPESRHIWEGTSAELGDCGWMGFICQSNIWVKKELGIRTLAYKLEFKSQARHL